MAPYTPNIQNTAFPPFFINQYVIEQLKLFGILSGTEQMVPIFPTTPTNIDEVFRNYIGAPNIDNPVLIQYERLIRFRPGPFYRHKREQLVYYLYCTDLSKIMNSHRIIVDALDREDAAAQDINEYCASIATEAMPYNVFFHNVRVFQVDETRDVMDLAAARTISANKIVIEYDYHTKDPANYPYT